MAKRVAPRRRRSVQADDVSYRRLRDAIVSGELMPSQRLVETGIAASLGVGRTAVRTALARLAQERLVERLPNRGARVRRVSDEEALEVFEVRLALECLAIRHAARNARPDDVRRLRTILTEMQTELRADNVAGYNEANAHFHRELMLMARHDTALRIWESLLSHALQLQRLAVTTRALDRLAEHRRIVAAIEAHDEGAAEATMRDHLSGIVTRRRERVALSHQRQARLGD